MIHRESHYHHCVTENFYTLPETNKWCLGDKPFPFRGEGGQKAYFEGFWLLVSGRVKSKTSKIRNQKSSPVKSDSLTVGGAKIPKKNPWRLAWLKFRAPTSHLRRYFSVRSPNTRCKLLFDVKPSPFTWWDGMTN